MTASDSYLSDPTLWDELEDIEAKTSSILFRRASMASCPNTLASMDNGMAASRYYSPSPSLSSSLGRSDLSSLSRSPSLCFSDVSSTCTSFSTSNPSSQSTCSASQPPRASSPASSTSTAVSPPPSLAPLPAAPQFDTPNWTAPQKHIFAEQFRHRIGHFARLGLGAYATPMLHADAPVVVAHLVTHPPSLPVGSQIEAADHHADVPPLASSRKAAKLEEDEVEELTESEEAPLSSVSIKSKPARPPKRRKAKQDAQDVSSDEDVADSKSDVTTSSPEKRFPCLYIGCDASLADARGRLRHLDTHFAVERFKCNFCNRSWKRKDEVPRHFRQKCGRKCAKKLEQAQQANPNIKDYRRTAPWMLPANFPLLREPERDDPFYHQWLVVKAELESSST
ncbi:hypothetical protein A0H81_09442 [Grifola frondosa]|uniref:C2H2-type domain-containing protein n=1 Tax=Grifola frondosa TaxID=5627 RepID=A0A1C7M0X6_GRIFR|nr:hypothetical protein A0H81_09442 [Grifola frondosa]